ncbi:ATP synthase subunit C [Candidatus Soleaferrea massiliensis]|uniref:ATP synthase subunit C n=1 Tax=Candidatus Soleaferrea massiliensis TaxID=1470354 RepID=UPI00058FEDFD|nr:ATP synthase subunit C [Candidatus Soleaferrea massiliensis]
MSTVLFFLVPLLVIALLIVPLVPVLKGTRTGKRAKNRIVFNLASFLGVCGLGTILPLGGAAFAADAAGAASYVGTAAGGMGFIAAALAVGLAGIGGGIAVAAAAPAAIGACSENPKSFGKSIIFVVLGEGIALYGLLIAILLIAKL